VPLRSALLVPFAVEAVRLLKVIDHLSSASWRSDEIGRPWLGASVIALLTEPKPGNIPILLNSYCVALVPDLRCAWFFSDWEWYVVWKPFWVYLKSVICMTAVMLSR
jgi:hypothetical protein